mmetsp:Transcript_34232/g.34885  ORF Transcript_34232/g.34885 Transcript_34232/m.34885 type:complete len:170 (+) Transcript_34232:235-744(+)|eukprot:CAMPEP_0182416556 /NCGR_PEP_ID=MMETSP1167-20130531/887_1 /TAXON_ID=2988 /ORGANISM="Mallomonas Sp, Strain CCMP3275" /LENGTH=169 /DNA_ID=CAMNT_0024589427 /DNA_START=192 /DNA_END=701 /DNA_ORIENTATION=-
MASFTSDEDFVFLTNEAIDFGFVINLVRCDSAGAISTFYGTTRDFFEGLRVTELQYEAYDEMAVDQMKLICSELRSRWSVMKVAIQHRLGVCPIGEVSVAIAVSSEHRRDSLQAVAHAIDRLKATVPIWKKECYAETEAIWKKNKEFISKDTSSLEPSSLSSSTSITET